jgi:hypothetical protein
MERSRASADKSRLEVRRRLQRRRLRIICSLALTALAVWFGARSGRAQASGVPADLQAQLLSKLSAYDRNFAPRAGDLALVLIVVKSNSAKSALSGATIKSAFSQLDRIGGVRHQEQVVTFESAAALASLCRSKRAAVVYVTPGLENDIDAIKSALTGIDVLSVAAVPEYVPRGIVVGFEVISGKPKLSINIAQARQQRVDFKADVLKLMKVYR